MKRQTIWQVAAVMFAGLVTSWAQSAATLEPVVAALEPVSLRTALARPWAQAQRTVIVPAREDSVLGLSHYSKEEFAAAGLDWNQFLSKATLAATRLLVSIKPIVAKDQAGGIAYIKLKSDRPFAASMIMSPRVVPLFESFLGDRLVALIPDRHTVYLFSRNFGEFQAFGQKIIDDHSDSVYPCSIEAFEITRDGVKCLGGFDDGAEAPLVIETKGEGGNTTLPRPELPKSPAPTSKVPLRKQQPAAANP